MATPAQAVVEAALAVDVGGTKMAAGLVTLAGEVVARASAPTPEGGDAEAVWAVVAGLVTGLLAPPAPPGGPSPVAGTAGPGGPSPVAGTAGPGGPSAVAGAGEAGPARAAGMAGPRAPSGVAGGREPPRPVAVVTCGAGCGGPMAPGGSRVSPLHIPGWRDFPLRDRLAALAEVPAHVDNDAKALALGEGWVGAARGVPDYLAMVVSTGVGGGIVLGGRLLEGAGGNAGHIGHVVVEPEGRACACGGRGCLEAEASGPAIAAWTGRPAAEAGVAARRRVGTLVGRAVASVANLLDLRLAVVGGSVALGYGDDFFGAARAELGRRARLPFSRGARIVPVAAGADAGLLGAAAVGWRAVGALPLVPAGRPAAGR
jgi:glucokinase